MTSDNDAKDNDVLLGLESILTLNFLHKGMKEQEFRSLTWAQAQAVCRKDFRYGKHPKLEQLFEPAKANVIKNWSRYEDNCFKYGKEQLETIVLLHFGESGSVVDGKTADAKLRKCFFFKYDYNFKSLPLERREKTIKRVVDALPEVVTESKALLKDWDKEDTKVVLEAFDEWMVDAVSNGDIADADEDVTRFHRFSSRRRNVFPTHKQALTKRNSELRALQQQVILPLTLQVNKLPFKDQDKAASAFAEEFRSAVQKIYPALCAREDGLEQAIRSAVPEQKPSAGS